MLPRAPGFFLRGRYPGVRGGGKSISVFIAYWHAIHHLCCTAPPVSSSVGVVRARGYEGGKSILVFIAYWHTIYHLCCTAPPVSFSVGVIRARGYEGGKSILAFIAYWHAIYHLCCTAPPVSFSVGVIRARGYEGGKGRPKLRYGDGGGEGYDAPPVSLPPAPQ